MLEYRRFFVILFSFGVWVGSFHLAWSQGGAPYGETPVAETNPDAALPSYFLDSKFQHLPLDLAKGEFALRPRSDIFVKGAGMDLYVSRNYSSQREYESIFGKGWTWQHVEALVSQSDYPNDHFKLILGEVEIELYRDYEEETYFEWEGPYLQEFWAGEVSGAGWTTPHRGEGAADAAFTETYGFDLHGDQSGSGKLIASDFDFDVPDAIDSRINYVGATVVGATAGNGFQQYGDQVRFSVVSGDGHLDWKGLEQGYWIFDATEARNWSWSKLRNIQLKLSKGPIIGTGWDDNLVIDAFNVEVHYDEKHEYTRWVPTKKFTLPKDVTFKFEQTYQRFKGVDKEGYLVTFKDKSRIFFDLDSGRMLFKKNSLGKALFFSYDTYPNGTTPLVELEYGSFVNPRFLRFHYGDSSHPKLVTKITDHTDLTHPGERKVEYAYDTHGYLTSFTDLEGHVTVYDCSSGNSDQELNGNIEKVTYPELNTIELFYDDDDRVEKFVDGEQVEHLIDYKDKQTYIHVVGENVFEGIGFSKNTDDIESIYVREGDIPESDGFLPGYRPEDRYFHHNDQHDVKWSMANGVKSTFEYDGNRNMKSKTIAGKVTWRFDYSPTWQKISKKTDPLGRVTTYIYDSASGNLKTVREALWSAGTPEYKVSYGYDACGNMRKRTDQKGYEEFFTYNQKGEFLETYKNKRGSEFHYEYDDAGNITMETDPKDHTKEFQYNGYNQVVWSKDQDGYITVKEYDKNARLTNIIVAVGQPEEASIATVYDKNSRIVEQRDAKEKASIFGADVYGNRTLEIDRLNQPSTFEYDIWDRQVRGVDPLLQDALGEFDGAGNLTKNTNKRGFSTENEYDYANRLIKTTDRDGNIVSASYDLVGNKIKEVFEAKSSDGDWLEPLVNTFEYDDNNRMTTKVVGANQPSPRMHTFEYTVRGELAKEVDPKGNYVEMQYDKNGNLTNRTHYSADDAWLAQTDYVYDELDLNVEIINYINQTVAVTNKFEYGPRKLRTAEIDANGNRIEYFYDGREQLTKVIYADLTEKTYKYDQVGNKTEEKDSMDLTVKFFWNEGMQMTQKVVGVGLDNARTNTYVYDLLGRLVDEIDAHDETVHQEYDEENNVISLVNKREYPSTQTYDALDRLTETKNALDHVVKNFYNGRGQIERGVNRRGKEKVFEYNVFGELVAETDPEGNTTRYEYGLNGNRTKVINARKVITMMSYNGLNQVTQKIVAAGTSDEQKMVYAYDALGRLLIKTDALDFTMEYTYDANGNVLTEQDKNGHLTTTFYDKMNRVTNIVDALENEEILIYDTRGVLVKSINKRGAETEYFYDAFRQVTQTVVEAETIVVQIYDRLGRPVEDEDPLHHKSYTEYDENGNVTKIIDRRDQETVFHYDKLDRLTNTVDALFQKTFVEYDEEDNVTKAIDKRTFETTSVYDDNNRMVEIRAPLQPPVLTAYDEVGNIVRVEDVLGLVIEKEYDSLNRTVKTTGGVGRQDARVSAVGYDANNRVISKTDALGYTVQYAYDKNGNRTKVINKRGYETNFEYDKLNRLTNTVNALTDNASHTYDEGGLVTESKDWRGHVVKSTYDNYGQRIEVEDAEGNVSSNKYDLAGRIVSQWNAKHVETRYTYDEEGNIMTKTVGYDLPDVRVLANTYDDLGRLFKSTDPLGTYTETHYDKSGNVTNVQHFSSIGTLLRESFAAYDRLNRPTTKTDFRDNTTTLAYDDRGQLIKAIDPLGGEIKTTYDIYGNVIAQEDQENAVTRTQYDKRNQLVQATDAFGYHSTFTYDENGNQIMVTDDDGNTILTEYDELDRQVAINKSMPDVTQDVLRRADVNGDGKIDSADVAALQAP